MVDGSLRKDMTSSIVIDALRIPWFKRHFGKHNGLMFHSDRGFEYASVAFRDVLKGYGINRSISWRGNCWDNPCCETLFGSLKVDACTGNGL